MTIDLVIWAAAALAAFAALSVYDGVIVHFFVERLPLRPASRLEHRVHTARALLFPAILVTFFGGRAMVAGWTLLAIDQALEVWDQAIERRSRVHTDGLPTGEYVVHGLLTTLRAVAIVLTAVIDRAALDTSVLDGLVATLLPGAVLAGFAHVLLVTRVGRAFFSPRSHAS